MYVSMSHLFLTERSARGGGRVHRRLLGRAVHVSEARRDGGRRAGCGLPRGRHRLQLDLSSGLLEDRDHIVMLALDSEVEGRAAILRLGVWVCSELEQ